jgi:hypothetical protein
MSRHIISAVNVPDESNVQQKNEPHAAPVSPDAEPYWLDDEH